MSLFFLSISQLEGNKKALCSLHTLSRIVPDPGQALNKYLSNEQICDVWPGLVCAAVCSDSG
jgi:hypothetical protein